jgi:hypothetical protein
VNGDLQSIKLNADGGERKLNLILRSGPFAASRRMGHKRLLPSFETPRKRAAPQDEGGASAPDCLQALKCQPLGVFDAGQIKPADEVRDLVAVTAGQNNDGVDGNPLGVHGFPLN